MKFKIEHDHKEYYYPFRVYVKEGFFSKWKKFGAYSGYMSEDKCIEAIEKFLIAREKIDNINKEIKERERRKNR